MENKLDGNAAAGTLQAIFPFDMTLAQATCTGCGATNPPTPAGTLAQQTAPLALPSTVLIGGVSAQVPFAGSLAGYVGLYQFNVIIPNLSPGDQTIELQIDGVGNAQNLYITVGQ